MKTSQDLENMNREEAVREVGLENVVLVESESCDFSDRVTEGTSYQGYVEFQSTISLDTDFYESLVAYYYQKQEDVETCEDLGELDWEIDHYELM